VTRHLRSATAPTPSVPARLRPGPRLGALAVTGVLLVTVAAACTAPGPDPRPAVNALAEGLATGDLTGVPLAGLAPQDATAWLQNATTGLGDLRPAVRVVDAVGGDDRDTARAELEQTWDLVPGGEVEWTYTTVVDLTLVDDTWQVTWAPALVAPDLQDEETLTLRHTAAPRGRILGAGGEPIVEDRPVLHLGLDKVQVEPGTQPESARRIADLVGLDPGEYTDRVAAAGAKAFVEALVVRAEDPGLDLQSFTAITGARAVDGTLPLAPTRQFARSVMGTAGPATAEIIEASGGAIQAGDVAGRSGLQGRYDDQLRGMPGLEVLALAGGDQGESDDPTERVVFSSDPVAGRDLGTTIDPGVQQTAEEVLADIQGPASIVALRPSTGAVLAVADGPGSQGYPTAVAGRYAPGSVFKVVSSLALLRAGLTPDSPVQCPDTLTVEGRTFHNFPDYPAAATGTIDLRTAIAQSCNTAIIALRDQATPTALIDAAASLGLGTDTDLGFDAFLGNVPADSTGTDHAAAMMGQARIEASPLAMATVAASIGAGTTVTPRLLDDAPDTAPPPTPLATDEASALRELMRAVVTDGGAQLLRDIPGAPVLAKTGTAQYGPGDQLANHAWMIALHDDLAVAVFVETGDYGSTTAGPLMARFLTELS